MNIGTEHGLAREIKGNLNKKIDLVIIEDLKVLANIWGNLARENGKEVDVYYDRKEFLANRHKYEKGTKIIINYGLNKTPNGVEVAKMLFKEGYTNLYLTTALNYETLEKYEVIPLYLTVVLKDDTDKLLSVIKE